MNKDAIIGAIFWFILTVTLVSYGYQRDREKTSTENTDGYREQCRHYHYGEDKIRECIDKFLVKP